MGTMDVRRVLTRFTASVWLFPVILLVIASLLATFRISGSSVGMYDRLAYGADHHDPHLLAGHPEQIRGDEWFTNTPLTVSQWREGFPKRNPDIGLGSDMSAVIDVPYKDWSIIFRPQNLAFFILPLEVAFAFKWWLIGFGLAISAYFFSLRILRDRRLVAALLGLTLLCSPFVQWWYQSITTLPLMLAFLILLTYDHLLTARSRARWWLAGALAYLLVCFALVLYTPFQVAAAFATGCAAVGLTIARGNSFTRRDWGRFVLLVGGAVVLAGGIVALFVATRLDAIKAILNSVYPGHRVVASGGFEKIQLLSGFLNYPLQSVEHAAQFATGNHGNQSEASNFIVLWPALLVPSVVLLTKRHRKRPAWFWPLLSVNLGLLVLCLQVFGPMPGFVSKLFLLNRTQHVRLLMGFGLLGVFQLLFFWAFAEKGITRRWSIAVAGSALLLFLAEALRIHQHYPGFVGRKVIILATLAIAIATYAALRRRMVVTLGILLALSVVSTYRIHPLYVGLSPLTQSPLAQALTAKTASGDQSHWVLVSNGTQGGEFFNNSLVAAGLPAYSATYPYPQLDTWKPFDPTGVNQNAYNRYAQVLFNIDAKAPVFRVAGDSFHVGYEPCLPVFKDRIQHVVSEQPLNDSCLVPADSVAYPKLTFYFYDVR